MVWCYYDGKAELRAVASDMGRARDYSKMFRDEFKFFERDVRKIKLSYGELEVWVSPDDTV